MAIYNSALNLYRRHLMQEWNVLLIIIVHLLELLQVFFQYVLFVMGYLVTLLSCNIYGRSYFNIETTVVPHLKSLGIIFEYEFKTFCLCIHCLPQTSVMESEYLCKEWTAWTFRIQKHYQRNQGKRSGSSITDLEFSSE